MTMSDPTAVALAHAGFCGPGAAVSPPEVSGNAAPDIGLLGEMVGSAAVAGGGLGAGAGVIVLMSGTDVNVGLVVAWVGELDIGWDDV